MKTLIRIVALTWLLAASATFAALREGVDYTLADNAAPPPKADDLVRITEFFNFSCPACNAYLPAVESWRAEIPQNTIWVRTPLAFSRFNGLYARTSYVLEAFDREDLVPEVFAAIHVEKKLLNSEGRIAEWLAEEHGINEDDANAAFESFGVLTKLKRTERLVSRFGVISTPTFVIADRYVLSPGLSKSPERLFATLDELMEAIRAGTPPI